MEYRRFGRTEIQMPVLTCGGMRYQQSWSDIDPKAVEEAGQRNLEATVLRALELGINHIETARFYGSSEMQLGWLLPKLPREKMIIQTKVEPSADPKVFLERFETSLRYLGLDYVDLLSLHGVNDEQTLEWSVQKGGCLEVARQLQREGRCRHVGFSTHGTNNLITKAIATDGFDYVNLHWYFVGELNWPSVQEATRRDMGVFIISPNDKGGMLYAPPEKLVRLCDPLSPMVFNDLFCFARPEVHTLSIGASKPEDFDEHMKAVALADRASELSGPIEARLRAELEAIHGREWMDGWWKGVPDYDALPGGVNLQEILRLWTYAKGLDLTQWGKMRYNLMGTAGHWFSGRVGGDWDLDALTESVSGCYPFAGKIRSILAEVHTLLHDVPKKRLSEGG